MARLWHWSEGTRVSDLVASIEVVPEGDQGSGDLAALVSGPHGDHCFATVEQFGEPKVMLVCGWHEFHPDLEF